MFAASAAFFVCSGIYGFPDNSGIMVPLFAGILLSALTIAGAFPLRFISPAAGTAAGLILLAALRLGGISDSAVWSGIPAERVRMIEGYVTEDAFRSANGKTIVRISLRRAKAQNGASADAGGTAVCLLPEAARLPAWGSSLTVLVRDFRTSQDGGGCFLYGQSAGMNGVNTVWRHPVYSVRYRVYSAVERKIERLSADSSALLKALLLGTREDLGLREQELFRKAGCMHILALSGMHLGIITGIALFVFGLFGPRKFAVSAAAAGVCMYVVIAGCRPSLVRAAVMVLLGTWAVLTEKKLTGRTALCLCFLAVSAAMPGYVYTLSFSLSFAAVAGIVFTAGRMHGIFKRYLPPAVSGPVSVSLGAQLFTAPILIINFGTLYPAGLLAAIPVGLLAAGYLGIGLFYILIPGEAGLNMWRRAFDIIRTGMIQSVRVAGTIPGIRCTALHALPVWAAGIAGVLCMLYLPELKVRFSRLKHYSTRRDRSSETS